MDIQEDKTVSVKGDRKNVKLAEDEIIKILEEQSFEAMISENFVGQIVGKNRSRIKEIRETSGAYVKIEERNKDSDPGIGFRRLEISGRQDEYMKAKKKVMDVLESKMRVDFERENNQKVFKKREVLEGVKYVSFVKDQELSF